MRSKIVPSSPPLCKSFVEPSSLSLKLHMLSHSTLCSPALLLFSCCFGPTVALEVKWQVVAGDVDTGILVVV